MPIRCNGGFCYGLVCVFKRMMLSSVQHLSVFFHKRKIFSLQNQSYYQKVEAGVTIAIHLTANLHLFPVLCLTLQNQNSFTYWTPTGLISKHPASNVFIYLFYFGAESQFPNKGSNLHPLQWKHGILTTRPPGKFLPNILETQSHSCYFAYDMQLS